MTTRRIVYADPVEAELVNDVLAAYANINAIDSFSRSSEARSANYVAKALSKCFVNYQHVEFAKFKLAEYRRIKRRQKKAAKEQQ